jgi:hypothetical protein
MTPAPAAIPRRELAAMRGRAIARRPRADGAAPRRTHVSLWLPTTLLFVMLAPFALLLVPIALLAFGRYAPNPLLATAAIGRVLLSLSGTSIDVDTPDARVRLRLF